MSKYETEGGNVTLALAYSKLVDLLNQARDQAYVCAHLVRAQASSARNPAKDNAVADGWICVGELLLRVIHQINKLAQGRIR